MTTVKVEKSLLQSGLDSLHEESREWGDDLDFLKTESAFLQRTLEQNALKAKTIRAQKEMEQLQNHLTYYRGEVIDELKHDLRTHEHQLAQLLTTAESKINEEPYRYQHAVLKDRIKSFRKEYNSWKGRLYQFVESLE